jgi:hypothetical protein
VARRGRGGAAAASAWRGKGGKRRRVLEAEEVRERLKRLGLWSGF